MSIRVIAWVWEHSRAEGTDRLVLLALADQARDDGQAWPSIATVAGKAKVSVRTVQRSIRSLTLLGEVLVEANTGTHGTNLYTVTMPPRTDDTPDIVTPVKKSPRQRATVTPVTPRGDTGDTRPVINPSTPQPPASGGPVAHCKRHSKYRKGCGMCDAAERARLAKRDAADKRASAAVFAEHRAAAAAAVPRPKDVAS